MKENNELERTDIAVDSDMEVDCDIGHQITCYLETWFDVDKKLGINTASEDGTWLNMYAKYNPFADTLRIECEISRDSEGRLCSDLSLKMQREITLEDINGFMERCGHIVSAEGAPVI